MGIDTKRFVNPVPQDFICPICNDVFDTPVQCKDEHIFCNACILKWMLKSNRCPLDQKSLCCTELILAPRVIRNMLYNLELRCEFFEHGCRATTTLETIEVHGTNCKFRSVMERRCEELRLLREQISELIEDVRTMGNNTKILNDALIETNAKLTAATTAIDDLQVQVDNKNSKIAQLEVQLGQSDRMLGQLQTEIDKLRQTNEAKNKKLNVELTKIENMVGNLAVSQHALMQRESANASITKHIGGITQEITGSLHKLAKKLNEIE